MSDVETLKYANITGSVEYDEKTESYSGQVLNLPGVIITYKGDTLRELAIDFQAAVDDYFEDVENSQY